MLLPNPTVELINAEGTKFDTENQVAEQALTDLVRAFPNNAESSHVLLKAVAINHIYGAGIPKQQYVETMAHHITGLHIDTALRAGKAAIVDDIINCGGLNKYFSFASKFCSWHNPTAYPIYDGNVDECLWSYNEREHFATYNRDKYSYVEFVDILNAFRRHFDLNAVSFKQLDKFLWHLGGQLLEEKAARKAAKAGR